MSRQSVFEGCGTQDASKSPPQRWREFKHKLLTQVWVTARCRWERLTMAAQPQAIIEIGEEHPTRSAGWLAYR